MNKWVIQIQTISDNMMEFNKIFFKDNKYVIPDGNVFGIIKVEENKECDCVDR